MHPLIIQAFATERSEQMRADAAAARRARENRRARRRGWGLARAPRPQPLRDPEAA